MANSVSMPPAGWLADPKVRQFAVWGAAGCLAGALMGQLLLAATRSHVIQGAQAVCLVIDCSGSMRGDKINEVKRAAADFVSRHNSPADRIAVVGFDNRVYHVCPLTGDGSRLKRAIGGLADGGSTAMDLGLLGGAQELDDLPGDWRDSSPTRSILLFTDGQPDNTEATLAAASSCRSSGLRIVAIGTGDADTGFLGRVTGDPNQVFHVGSGDFEAGFKQAEKAIYGGSLVEAGGGNESILRTLFRTGAWGVLAACGLSLALVAGQNRYVRRAALTGSEAVAAGLRGAAAGFCGAVAGQLLYSIASASANLPGIGLLAPLTMPLSRIVGWALMGMLAGWGMSWFVPNLGANRAALGGAIGGAVGGLAFLVAMQVTGDFLGALLGAAILGAAIGLAVAWVEAAFRQAWLEVYYGGKEVITVSLGAKPVKIGSDNRACQVYARGSRPLACQYTFADGQVVYVDFATERSTPVEPGHEQDVGGVRVIVRGSRRAEGTVGAGSAGQAAPGQVRSAAPPPPPKVVHASAPPPPDAIAPDAKAPARTLSAPPPPPLKGGASGKGSTSSSPAPTVVPPGETRVIRPVPPPPPPHKKE
ncbi:MAG TPA: vWA domain-containing protein [Pirellulales bacterium]|jgi:Ca-activated chloride channel family protein|nr:vWA domain-containing protein [Pirellulales bacterium]